MNNETKQKEIEIKMLQMNKGICLSYNICKYCKAKGHLELDMDYPCLDAKRRMEKDLGEKVAITTIGGRLRILDRTWRVKNNDDKRIKKAK